MTLQDERFFVEGWTSSVFDWFVIGGRWSGELSRYSWAKSITHAMKSIEQEKDVRVWLVWYSDDKTKQRAQRELARQFQEMWDNAAPKEYRGIPIQRDTYRELGYEDDAMPLTQELYDELLKEYEGTSQSWYHVDLDGDAVSPEMIDKKWIVVVDYHN